MCDIKAVRFAGKGYIRKHLLSIHGRHLSRGSWDIVLPSARPLLPLGNSPRTAICSLSLGLGSRREYRSENVSSKLGLNFMIRIIIIQPRDFDSDKTRSWSLEVRISCALVGKKCLRSPIVSISKQNRNSWNIPNLQTELCRKWWEQRERAFKDCVIRFRIHDEMQWWPRKRGEAINWK